MKPDEPGVIISKVEKGEKAAVSGLKPYERILAVDDRPVRNVRELEAVFAKGGKLQLRVKRMNEGRIVTLTVDGK